MSDAFDPERRLELLGDCTARRPWLVGNERDPDGCDREARALLRGASNAYFPVLRSALSIPPWAEPIHEAISRRDRDLVKVHSLLELEMLLRLANFEDLNRWKPDEIWKAIEKRRGLAPLQIEDLLYPEWEALRQPATAQEGEFQTAATGTPMEFVALLSRVVLVRRLKEVRAIQAFTRLDSWADLEVGGAIDPERLAPLSANDLGWLPALLVRGEGLFVELDETAVRRWEGSPTVRREHARVVDAFDRWRDDRNLPPAPCPPARYLLIHSMSHIVIRQLALECGYGVSALRERIYASDDAVSPMAGFLVYTGTPDSDGSLGGLVDLGTPVTLGPLMLDALYQGQVCASDPLCADSPPGERGIVNGAACHACLLLPETCCERSNRFLDRSLLVPTLAGPEAAYFGELITAL